jgi:hypothetical protein
MNRPASYIASDNASYLLHIWREKNGATPIWRASVTLIVEGRRQGFPHPEAALHFLADRLGELQFSPFHVARSGKVSTSEGSNLPPMPAPPAAIPPTPPLPEEDSPPGP